MINLLSLMLAEAWFIKTPDWEPAILFIGFLSALVIQELKSEHLNYKLSKKEKLETLYIKVHEMMEELIKATKTYEKINLSSKFSKLTAEIQIIAKPSIIKQYKKVTNLYTDWASLYIKAYPKPKNGMQILYSENADPTKKYQKLEKEIYEKFYKEYENLINDMHFEIEKKT